MIEKSVMLEYIVGAAHISPNTRFPCQMGMASRLYACVTPSPYSAVVDTISSIPTGIWATFILEVVKTPLGDTKKPVLRIIKFRSVDADAAKTAVDTVLNKLYPDRLEKKILFILNPHGGVKKAKSCYHDTIFPFMCMAGYRDHHQLIETQAPMHATKIAQTLDVNQYKCATTISGDGVFHEFINGLFTRTDWDAARRLPVGIIGAGSSNAMSKNLDLNFAELGTLATLKCHTKSIDIFSYTQNNTRMFSHLLVMFAFLADIDIESDKYRYIGTSRFILAAIVRLFKFRNYKANVHILTAEEASHYKLEKNAVQKSVGPPSLYTSADSQAYKNWPIHINPYLQLFVATKHPYISSDFLVAPSIKSDDGQMQIVWSEDMGAQKTLLAILDQETGKFLTFDSTRQAKAVAFVIEPEPYVYKIPKNTQDFAGDGSQSSAAKSLGVSRIASTRNPGIMDVSGEEVSYESITVEVHPKMLNCIVPVWLDQQRWEKQFLERFDGRGTKLYF
ncbi:hypothetical protein RTP6_000423 [Batrachochytrium dendrobatidis]